MSLLSSSRCSPSANVAPKLLMAEKLNAQEFDDPDELPPLYWEGYDRGYEEALESMAYTRPPRVRPPKSKKKGA